MLKQGDRIELIRMEEDPDPVPVGTTGTVVSVNPVNLGGDSFDQIDVRWDNGRRLMVCTPPDAIRLV